MPAFPDDPSLTTPNTSGNVKSWLLALKAACTGLLGSTGTAADARIALSAAKSGANSDITSLSGLTTPLSVAQGGTGTTEAPTPVVSTGVRQTVLSGPVDASGHAAFGTATGPTTVTLAGTLIATAANGYGPAGQVDRVGSITDQSWTGLSTNGTMYLYLDIASNGVCTPGSTIYAPIYQFGGTPTTINGRSTFDIQKMQMFTGNGSTAPQTYRVFIGEVTVSGGVVTGIMWYALLGRYASAWTATLPVGGTRASRNHLLGYGSDSGGAAALMTAGYILECTSADMGYVPGEQIDRVTTVASGGQQTTLTPVLNRLSVSITPGNAYATPFLAHNPTDGSSPGYFLASAKWKYRLTVNRGW